MKQEHAEHKLLRDIWKAERESRNRWWITAVVAALSVLVVYIAVKAR